MKLTKIEYKKGNYYVGKHIFQDYQWQIAILYCVMCNMFTDKYNVPDEKNLKDGSFIEMPDEAIEIIDGKAFVKESMYLSLE